MKKRQQGFTLLEVMVVLIVIAILTAIMLPLYQHYVAKAQVMAALADITPGRTPAGNHLNRACNEQPHCRQCRQLSRISSV